MERRKEWLSESVDLSILRGEAWSRQRQICNRLLKVNLLGTKIDVESTVLARRIAGRVLLPGPRLPDSALENPKREERGLPVRWIQGGRLV